MGEIARYRVARSPKAECPRSKVHGVIGAPPLSHNAVGKNALAFRRVMNCWWRRCVLCLACALQERPPLLGAGRFTWHACETPKTPAFRTPFFAARFAAYYCARRIT